MLSYRPSEYALTESEYWEVYDWIDAEKDRLQGPLKEGLLKLVNGEGRRRLQASLTPPAPDCGITFSYERGQ